MFSTSSLILLLARSRSGERCPNEANIHKYITSHLHIAMAGGERRKKTSTGSEGCKNKKSPSSSAARQMQDENKCFFGDSNTAKFFMKNMKINAFSRSTLPSKKFSLRVAAVSAVFRYNFEFG